MKYESITASDVNNGLGCRVTLWVSGCTHHCKNCHNRKTWSFNSGKVYDQNVEEVLFNEIDKPYIKGLTLSGGLTVLMVYLNCYNISERGLVTVRMCGFIQVTLMKSAWNISKTFLDMQTFLLKDYMYTVKEIPHWHSEVHQIRE